MPSEQFISDNTASGLNGTTMDGGLPIPAWDTTDWATPAARLYDRLRRLFGPAGGLEVFKDGDLTFGVRAGSFLDGDSVVTFSAVGGEGLTDDDTNYIYLIDDGTLTVSLTGFPTPSATPHVPLATIATGSESVAGTSGLYSFVDIVDYRGRGMLRLAVGQTADQQNSGGGSVVIKNIGGSPLAAGAHRYFAGVSSGYLMTGAAGTAIGVPAECVCAEEIAAAATGRAVMVGLIENVDTSSWAAGTVLYLSSTGTWTSTPPTGAADIVQPLAIVITQDASTGSVFAYPGMTAITKWGTTSLQNEAVTAAILAATLDLTGKEVSVATPTAAAHAVTKAYVDAALRGLDWQESVLDEVDFTTSEPGGPSTGDRYINTATGDSSGTSQAVTAKYIYEWNGVDWTETVPDEGTACRVEDTNVHKVYNGAAWVGIGTGSNLDDIVDGATYKRLAAVDGSNQAATASLGDAIVTAPKMNANQAKQTFIVWVEDLAAGVDISGRPVFVWPVGGTLETIGILTQGAPAGVDDANTAVIELKDDAANSIVSKTYDTANQPPSSDYADLGALSGTHKVLAATEHVTLDVTKGATADLPAFGLVFTIIPTDA